jgi:hypothetical protein
MNEKQSQVLGTIIGIVVLVAIIGWKEGWFDSPQETAAETTSSQTVPYVPGYPNYSQDPTADRWRQEEEARAAQRIEQEYQYKVRQIEEDRRRWEEEKRQMDARTAGNPYMR